MSQLTQIVESKISNLLPKTIALVFDGWSQISTHYFAVYVSFLDIHENGFDDCLLAMPPLEGETKLDVHENH